MHLEHGYVYNRSKSTGNTIMSCICEVMSYLVLYGLCHFLIIGHPMQ